MTIRGQGASNDVVVDPERRRRWLDVIGADHWEIDLGGWTLIAVNAQLFGSDLDAEQVQWEWLEERISGFGSDRRQALLSHKPWMATETELAAAPPYRFVPQPARSRLSHLLGDRALDLVVSGHVHQYRTLHLGGTTHLWAPTTWAVLPDELQPRFGTKRSGLVSLTLEDGRFEQELIEPEGLAQLTLLDDVANPYEH